jgi:hypothetical protein
LLLVGSKSEPQSDYLAENALAVKKKLPPAERSLFIWLILVLQQVTQNKEFNKMDSSNLGIVFGPLLSQSRNPIHALMQTAKVVQILCLNLANPPTAEESLPDAYVQELSTSPCLWVCP